MKKNNKIENATEGDIDVYDQKNNNNNSKLTVYVNVFNKEKKNVESLQKSCI